MVLGVGNLLHTDDGFGIRVVERMRERYAFGEGINLVDGGVLGMSLLGLMGEADHLIVVDAMRGGEEPGTLYRLNVDELPGRIRAKNSLHQTDLLEALTLCEVVGKAPKTVILGVEPMEMERMGMALTPVVESRLDPMIERVLEEVARLGGSFREKEVESTPG